MRNKDGHVCPGYIHYYSKSPIYTTTISTGNRMSAKNVFVVYDASELIWFIHNHFPV